MKRFLLKVALQTQTYRMTRLWYRNRLILLTYHGLTDEPGHAGIANYHGKHLFIGTLRAHFDYLKRHYHVIGLEQAVDHYERGTPLPPRSVVLTFDDGYRSIYRLGFPLLREYGFPASFFLATDFVDRRDWLWTDRLEFALDATEAQGLEVTLGADTHHFDLTSAASRIAAESRLRSLLKRIPQDALHETIAGIEDRLGVRLSSAAHAPELYRPVEWHEVREMVASGLVTVGSHTASHVILARCPEARLGSELASSREVIESRTGAACTLFCYPNGKPGCFDGRTRAAVRKAGYRSALTTVEGMNDDEADVFELKRLSIPERGDLDRFRLSLSGLMGHLDALQMSARRWMARPQVEA